MFSEVFSKASRCVDGGTSERTSKACFVYGPLPRHKARKQATNRQNRSERNAAEGAIPSPLFRSFNFLRPFDW